ncbi:unnamed protein product [Closterium sp. NIES-53]
MPAPLFRLLKTRISFEFSSTSPIQCTLNPIYPPQAANFQPSAVTLHVDLQGIAASGPVLLTRLSSPSGNPDDGNSLEDPVKVSPIVDVQNATTLKYLIPSMSAFTVELPILDL